MVEALLARTSREAWPARLRVLVRLAVALTVEPSADPERHVVAARDAGLTDRGVHDAVNVVAYFNYVNRVALGLGVELEPETGAAGTGK